MPSDERAARALEALADGVTSVRAMLTTARDEIREHVDEHGGVEHDRVQAAAWSLGPFASGRIDTRRFGALLADERVLAPAAAALLTKCVGVLDELLARGDALFVHRVPSGGLLRATVDIALADAGRAFAAARVYQAVRRGESPVAVHEAMLREFPFALWSRRERDLAPPMVIEIDGADLHAEHLVEYLDGTVRLVLVAGEPAPPAPLVRLIAPSVLVLQTSDERALERLSGASGPAVAALLPTGCAELLHDPRKGERLDERLTIAPPTGGAEAAALGWRSARQSRDELAQLEALAEVCRAARDVAVVVVPPLLEGGVVDGDRAVDAVAAWMLAQAGFTGGVP
jgi:hypothetical protein